MRALFVAPEMERGGAERHWATLIVALHGRGVQVRLLCLNREGPLFEEVRAAGVPAACAHLGGRADVRGLRRALAEAAGRPDVVVTRGVSPQLVGEAIAGRAGAAHVLNEHTPLTPAGELLPMRAHQRLLTRLVAPRVDLVISVSERQAPPLRRLGYRRDRIVTVPNGVFDSDVAVQTDPRLTRQALGLEADDFAVLYVANLRREKGVRGFIEAMSLARERAPRLRGLVAGDGPERARLEELLDEREGVRLLGSRGDVPDLIAACDALCLLSHAEALPISILEAMALARPVLTTDVGGTAEAVQDGVTGIVVAPGHGAATAAALEQLAANREWARELGRRGRERQRERFGGDAMVDGYLRVLEGVAAR
jgi:glycosyltransferase involved in cell wall biosynthesis